MIRSIMAGCMVGIGVTVYLSCENKYIGALLFTVGLFTICSFELALFTGMNGYAKTVSDILDLAFVWLGNLMGISTVSLMMAAAKPEISELSASISALKVSQSTYQTLILSILCGALMYIAVSVYKTRDDLSRYLGMFLCVPTFALCGFEHSIANMFYMVAGLLKTYTLKQALLHSAIATLGNTIGAVAFRAAHSYTKNH